jgi:hypothetical protein
MKTWDVQKLSLHIFFQPARMPISRIYGAAAGRSSLFLQEALPQGCGSSVIYPKIIVSDA